ncbi:MAG: M1 family metallopeptidase [Ignavibacteria bacterium]|nr:M1 family metallopeptidase [Ignavibacteria bacterium]MBK7031750.1 M1 family metallopeptidase [Ignavibacteria bacterium]
MIARLLSAVLILVAGGSLSLVMAQENKSSFIDWLITDDVLQETMQPRHHMRLMAESFPQKTIDTTIDVISYDLVLDWYSALLTPKAQRPERKANGRMTAVVRSRVNDLAQIDFDAVSLIIDSITSGGTSVVFTKNVRSISMTLPSPLQRGQDVELVIHYAITRDDRAIFFYSKSDAATENSPYASAYTISEPEDSRRWYPCNDQPDDKALFSVQVRVPKGFTVVSNGVRTDSVLVGDTASIQTWKHDVPMPTYLFAVSASEYILYPQVYTRTDNSSVPISNYHFDVDQDGPFYNATRALQNIPLMFEAFEERFGLYPFQTYGHVTVSPFQYGGMEHQTMSTINRRWLAGDVEGGYAHELAHHWFGDQVTCATWADIWLNEGGASWGEAVYQEHRSGFTGYMQVLWEKRARYMLTGLNEPPVYNIPIGILFNEATTYNKSSWIYHMMRRNVGDEVFFPAIRGYLAKYNIGSAQTYQLLDHMKEAAPNPLVAWDTFFDQWLVKAGHPVLEVIVSTTTRPTPFVYRVTIAQTQEHEGVPDAFVVPVHLRFIGFGEVLDTTVIVRERSVTMEFAVGFDADEVLVDPDNDILCVKGETLVGVDEQVQSDSWCGILGPHPITAGSPLRIYLDETSKASVEVRSITGSLVASASVSSGVSLLDTSSLAPGSYAVSIISGTRVYHRTVIITAQ